MSMISVVGHERPWFAAATGIDHREPRLADPICAHAIGGGDDGIRFYAGMPLVMRDGLDVDERQALGALPRRAVAAIELHRALHDGAVGTREALMDDASARLVAARAALELGGCTAPLARLEHVVALLDDGRRAS